MMRAPIVLGPEHAPLIDALAAWTVRIQARLAQNKNAQPVISAPATRASA